MDSLRVCVCVCERERERERERKGGREREKLKWWRSDGDNGRSRESMKTSFQ